MELLKKSVSLSLIITTTLACGLVPTTYTETVYVRTDSTIASFKSPSTEESQLYISNEQGNEQRVLFKLPTGKQSPEENLDALFDEFEDIFLFPLLPIFILTVAIKRALLGCTSDSFFEQNLTDAKLVFDIESSSTVPTSSDLRIALVSKPWWTKVNWNRAHPFSSSGRWTTPGGDTDPAFTPIAPTISGTEVSFNITDYMKTIVGRDDNPHFGFLISTTSSISTSAPIVFKSTQNIASAARPRLVSTYTCGAAIALATPEPKPFHYYFEPNSIVKSL